MKTMYDIRFKKMDIKSLRFAENVMHQILRKAESEIEQLKCWNHGYTDETVNQWRKDLVTHHVRMEGVSFFGGKILAVTFDDEQNITVDVIHPRDLRNKV